MDRKITVFTHRTTGAQVAFLVFGETYHTHAEVGLTHEHWDKQTVHETAPAEPEGYVDATDITD